MASLVEFQDFNLNHLPPHHSVMMPTIPEMQTLEEIMAQDVNVEPLPTPPLSPDHDICCPSPSSESSSHDLDSGDGMEIMAEALLNEMMSYEQLFTEATDEESGGIAGGAQGPAFSLEGHFLVQDCMWNSHTYQPRNTISLGANGVYTPAPSPPPQMLSAAERNSQEEGEDEEEEDAPTPRNNASSDGSASDQTDCISPNDVFPTCMVMPKIKAEDDDDDNVAMGEPTKKKVKVQPVRHTRQERARRAMEREQRSTRGGERTSSIMTRRAAANTNGNSRVQPQASTSSESEEEIDVVTVSERPERTLTRSNSRRRPSSSASAPCSRHASPTPSSSPTKKRRYHAKRLQRIRSTGEDITESDDEQRRASHNILERKRRNDLKYSFQLLREQVPELEDNQRAPKVIILRKAAEFIKYIREREEKLEQEFEREKKREAKLQQKLEYLKAMPLVC